MAVDSYWSFARPNPTGTTKTPPVTYGAPIVPRTFGLGSGVTAPGSNGLAPGWSGYAPAGRTIDLFPNGIPGLTGPPATPGAGSPLTSDSFTLLKKTKDPAQEARINAIAGDYDALRTSGNEDLKTFTTNYLAANPEAKQNLAEENSVIDRFYSGEVGNDLTRLRNQRRAAMAGITDRDLAYATAGRKLSALGRSGAGSSYDTKLGLKQGADIMTREALDQAAQERLDYDYLTQGKLNLAGRRTAAQDEYLRRALVPSAARAAFLNTLLGGTGDIGRQGRENTFYGLGKPYDPNYEASFDGFNFSTGPRGGGGGGAPARFGGPPAGGLAPQPGGPRGGGAPNYSVPPPGRTTDPRFPGGGFRDQYGRWMERDATGRWVHVATPEEMGRYYNALPFEEQFNLGTNVGGNTPTYLPFEEEFNMGT